MTHYDITIVSDTICPWCYVGKNRFDLAVAQHKRLHPDDTFSTEWKPYFLNPDAPVPGVDKQAHYEAKFGAQRTAAMHTHLARLGAAVGIDFAFGGLTGNTRDSHRIITMARTTNDGEAAQTRVVEELFKSYFEKEEDITDHKVLVAAAQRAGLDGALVREWLSTDKGGKEVDQDVVAARRQFIRGVPNFTIQGRYEVQGAEDPAKFLEIFEQIRQAQGNGDKRGVVGGGETC